MKKALLILSGVAILALMAFQLYNNKVEMAENAKLSEISSDAIPVETTKASRKVLEEVLGSLDVVFGEIDRWV